MVLRSTSTGRRWLRRARARGTSSIVATLAIVGVALTAGLAGVAAIGDSMESKGADLGTCIASSSCKAGGSTGDPGRISDFRGQPAAATEPPSTLSKIGGFFRDVADGAVRGDFVENPSIASSTGQILVGFTPLGVVGDVRDLGAAARDVFEGREGAWTNVGLAALGVVPGGNAVKAVVRAHKAEKIVEAGATAVRAGERAAAAGARASIAPGKLGYLLGHASGRDHNVQRALQNKAELARIGVHDTEEGRALLQAHFEKVVEDPSNVARTFTNEWGTFEVRESLLNGPGGFVKFESTWQVMGDGTYRFSTGIPFAGAR